MNGLNRLRMAIATNRYEAVERARVEADSIRRQSNFSVTHEGFSDGAYIGRLSGGGKVRIKATTNGAIRKGEVYNARRSRLNNKLEGKWNNYSG